MAAPAAVTAMVPRRVLYVATNLGLRPTGVERLGEVLLDLGLADRVGVVAHCYDMS